MVFVQSDNLDVAIASGPEKEGCKIGWNWIAMGWVGEEPVSGCDQIFWVGSFEDQHSARRQYAHCLAQYVKNLIVGKMLNQMKPCDGRCSSFLHAPQMGER